MGQNGGQTSTHIGITIKILLINVGKIKPANLMVNVSEDMPYEYLYVNIHKAFSLISLSTS